MKLAISLILFFINVAFAQLNITTTIKPLADIAKEVGGNKVNVKYLIPPNLNFHNYEYKPNDIKSIYESDLFIYVGTGEGNINSFVKNLNKRKVLKLIDLKSLYLIKEEDHDEIHPALWLNLDNAKVIGKSIYDYLIKIDSKNQNYYKANLDKFLNSIDQLIVYGREKLSKVKNKNFVSYHYEFPYFVNYFNLNYLAEIEMVHGREPTLKHILEVIDKIKKYNVKAIFTSKQFYNPKTVNVVVSQTNVKVIFLDTFGENKNYIEMMRFNIDKVYEGLNL